MPNNPPPLYDIAHPHEGRGTALSLLCRYCFGRGAPPAISRGGRPSRRCLRGLALLHQLAVDALLAAHQGGGRGELQHLPGAQHHDAVAVGDGVQAVRDGERGAALEDLADRALELASVSTSQDAVASSSRMIFDPRSSARACPTADPPVRTQVSLLASRKE
eukprot:CAMPEP_0118939850 /NCGR_PEP_ID=MMETSP1169-20130426/30013_1 /TAXON_ID=36882 /ORGANISM="Pyramimonas obovata, Strain CCMP722" /LENGTH=161 /DNA_ID=CAMNT_0006884207 /DNA_START=220 /DNA_END=707 /DNA_ORIENTATION=-